MFRRLMMKRTIAMIQETLTPEPGGKITIMETWRKVIKAEVLPSGAKRFSIHKVGIAKAGRRVWRYTMYAITDTGGYHALYSGQYPYSWKD